MWERGLAVSTKIASATGLTQPPTQLFVPTRSISSPKFVELLLVVTLQLLSLDLHPYQAQPPQIRLMLALKLMTTHSLLQQPEKTITVTLN